MLPTKLPQSSGPSALKLETAHPSKSVLPFKIRVLVSLERFSHLRKSAYLLTYLPTPWCRVLIEKLTGLQLVKTFPAFHGTRRFITALTSVRHLSLSWASPVQSTYPHPTSWRSILILSTHLRLGLPSGLLSSGFPAKTLYTPTPSASFLRQCQRPSFTPIQKQAKL